jgi:hypothetical protein
VGTTRVQIEGPTGLLAQLAAGAATPSVTVLSPNGGETLPGNTIAVAWSASDPDGDPLTFDVQYSPDNGATWQMVAQYLTTTSVALDATNIPAGASAQFRVAASDGIHTAYDQSDAPFTVPNRAPQVAITSPASGITVAVSQTVTLAGSAYDLDTGSMSGDQLQWTSSLDGPLGTGATLSVATLSAGVHTMTFRADDGQGGVATATVQVTVVSDPTQLPAPANHLIAGPSPIIFEPAAGVASTTITLDNGAGVPIAWPVGPTVGWVQLSAYSGTTPQQITVTLNPVGLRRGMYQAAITFTSPDAPGESAVEVRAVIRGDYLPLIRH